MPMLVQAAGQSPYHWTLTLSTGCLEVGLQTACPPPMHLLRYASKATAGQLVGKITAPRIGMYMQL